jgi:hypothetical protein
LLSELEKDWQVEDVMIRDTRRARVKLGLFLSYIRKRACGTDLDVVWTQRPEAERALFSRLNIPLRECGEKALI